MENAQIPVTVVTGFLGAGKTTLVNHILTGNHGKSIAVIENEYGEVGIDDALVLETKEEIFEMNNGCVCCTVRGDLIRILNKLLKRKKKFDAILIETTGLAHPGPVIQTFFVDEDIRDGTKLDAVLTVIDTKHIMQHLDEKKEDGFVNEAIQQVAFADKLLLNKLDLVTAAEKAAVIARVKDINGTAKIIDCEHSKVDLDAILGIGAFSLANLLESDPTFLGNDEPKAHSHGHSHGDARAHGGGHAHGHTEHACDDECAHHHAHDGHAHSHAHEHGHAEHACDDECAHHHAHDGHAHSHAHKHDDKVSSVGFEIDGYCNARQVQMWLRDLLQTKGADIFRSKGVLSMDGTEDRVVFQGVHMICQFFSSQETGGRKWRADEKRTNKLVFIGQNLNRSELETAFRACLVSK